MPQSRQFLNLAEKLKLIEQSGIINTKNCFNAGNKNSTQEPEKLKTDAKGHFHNPYEFSTPKEFKAFLDWRRGYKPEKEIEYEQNIYNSEKFKAIVEKFDADKINLKFIDQIDKIDLESLKTAPEKSNVKITWFGHSTVLAQFCLPKNDTCESYNVLFDPVFSERCSPLSFIGPKRNTKIPASIKELYENKVPIDCVVISHAHYDHLDSVTLKEIKKLYKNAKFIAGASNLNLVMKESEFDSPHEEVGYNKIVEADSKNNNNNKTGHELYWWQSINLNESIKITAVPACHWANRSLNDHNRYLWAGFVVENLSDNTSVYFAGDTGYCSAFKEIGEHFKNLTIGLIPIGAYQPRWFMAPQHISPEEAVQVFKDVKAKYGMPIHWLTFSLADDRGFLPYQEMEYFKEKMGVENFVAQFIGETKNYQA